MKTLFLEVTPEKGIHDLCGRNFVGKIHTRKLFGQVWEIRTKILRTPENFACSYTYPVQSWPSQKL